MSAGAGICLIFAQLSMLLTLFLDGTGFFKRKLEGERRIVIEYYAYRCTKHLFIFLVVLWVVLIPFSIYIETLDLILGFALLFFTFWVHGWVLSKKARDLL